MAHHYPPHTQTQGYQSFANPPYNFNAGFYPGYQARPGAAGYVFDGAAGANHPHGGPPTAPEIPGVSSQLASQALQRLISHEMRDAGFESAEQGAVARLELEVASFTYCRARMPPPAWLRHNLTESQSSSSCMSARTSMPTLQVAPSLWSAMFCAPRTTTTSRQVRSTASARSLARGSGVCCPSQSYMLI